ncbi:sensor histidine kinase [Phocaeicola plebeius]|uniref:sensor histidine kinase n=1 Tax=Phocaeicola plebeius TaxID=310297 RepID=UPI00356AC981
MKKMQSIRNNTTLYVSILTFIGLVSVITLQSIWLFNTYKLIENNIQKESYATIEKALEEEGNMRFGQTPKGTKIKSGPTNDTIPPMTYFYERLSDMGYPMSLHNLDSITAELLIQNGLGKQYYIYIINLRTGEKLNGIGTQREPSFMAIKPKYFPIRSDYTQVVQLIITNPNKTFLERMGLLIIATIIIMVFVIGSITYQIKIISRINKISQIREDFSYAMVHDMKTPLSSILSALNFLQGGRLDSKPEMKEKFFNIAKDEADHLLTLTNKVLTISKLENNKLEMNCEMVMLKHLLLKISEKFKAKSPKPVTFKFDLEAESIYADAEYIEEVFCNMIDNSIKYSNDSVDIKISSSENSKYSIIKIYDNGLGMNEDDQLKIFNKYERAYASRKKKTYASGFGLGLNFVQQVIEAHKGKIIVNSVEGEFTEFIIYLPLILKEL